MTQEEANELQRRCELARARSRLRKATAAINPTCGLAPDPVQQSNSINELVAEDAREIAHQSRCLVRITSFRTRLLDRRNLWDKHFVDALVESALLFDDSEEYAHVEVEQEKVNDPALQRTEIEITRLT